METVAVEPSAVFSPRSAAARGETGWGTATLFTGAVLVDMNCGAASADGAAGCLFSNMVGGGTGRDGAADFAGEGILLSGTVAVGTAAGCSPDDGASGFSLMVLRAAAEAGDEFGGILFKAAVSVLRIFSGSMPPAGVLISFSLIVSVLVSATVSLLSCKEYSIQNMDGKSFSAKKTGFLEKTAPFSQKTAKKS